MACILRVSSPVEMDKVELSFRRACGRLPTITASDRMTHIHEVRIDMVLRLLDVGKRLTRIAPEEDGSKKQRPPSRVAVFTIDCATVWSGVCTYTAWRYG